MQTGGTIFECGLALLASGAKNVNAFAAHGVFPNQAWKPFSKTLNGSRSIFEKMWITNSIPSVSSQLPINDVFEVLDLTPLILHDLDSF